MDNDQYKVVQYLRQRYKGAVSKLSDQDLFELHLAFHSDKIFIENYFMDYLKVKDKL